MPLFWLIWLMHFNGSRYEFKSSSGRRIRTETSHHISNKLGMKDHCLSLHLFFMVLIPTSFDWRFTWSAYKLKEKDDILWSKTASNLQQSDWQVRMVSLQHIDNNACARCCTFFTSSEVWGTYRMWWQTPECQNPSLWSGYHSSYIAQKQTGAHM